MLDKIIHYSPHNRLVVLHVAILLFIVGIYTAMHMEVDVFPDLSVPTVVVTTEANGMAVEGAKQLVILPVETAVSRATGVRRVRSSSTNGFPVVWVEFDWGIDIYLARQIVSEELAVASESFPVNVGKPTLGLQPSILDEVLTVGLTVDFTFTLDLRMIANRTIRLRLLSTGGVAQAAVSGGDIKEYQIQLDSERMRHYGISMGEVMAVIQDMNLNANGGVLYEFGNEYTVRGVFSTPRAEELGKVVVKTVNNLSVVLEGIADVKIGPKAPKLGTASEHGRPAVFMTVTKQPAISTLELTDKLEASPQNLQKNLPANVKVSMGVFRQSRFIESSVGNVKKSLFEGGIPVVTVFFLFLVNVRTTLISPATLPLLLLVSILTLHYMGLAINTMSPGGMAIVIGSLVDGAIVDVENVYKRLRENRLKAEVKRLSMFEVVFNASKEVRMPILNSTLIIVASFVPLFFLSGVEGRMLVPLGIAFIVALFISTVAALMLTPVFCSYLLGSNKTNKELKESSLARWMKSIYEKALTWVLTHKRVTLGSTIVLSLIALGVFFMFGCSFLPSFNEGSFTTNISSLSGISLEGSNKMGHRVEGLLLTIPEIQTVAHKTGRAEPNEHMLGVSVSGIEAPLELKGRPRSELVAEVREKLGTVTGANIEIGQPTNHRIDAVPSGTKANIAIKLFGDDLNKIPSLDNRIKGVISDIPGIADLNVEQQIERPQLKIQPKREMLAKFGITLPEFSEYVNVVLAGKVISQMHEQGKSSDLIVRVKDDARDEMEKIRNLMADTNNGCKIPLNHVAEIAPSVGPNTINRENVKRKIVIFANVADRDLHSVVNGIQKQVDAIIQSSEGYHIEYGGQLESEQTASRVSVLTSLMSIVIISLLLHHELRSVKESGVILLNLLLALIGGVLALVITTGEVNIPAIIGFISLFGIATRNGMPLISHYNHLQQVEGLNVYNSMIQGLLNRLNPVLMTALSSALVLIPLALGDGLPDNEIQDPMAKVILGGPLTSTFLNGFIVPIVYLMMHRQRSVGANSPCGVPVE